MSRETIAHLNTQTLIGMTDERGHAWHYRAEDQGDESNHYDGAIPVGDVSRRLFNWTPVKVPIFAQVPALSVDDATGMDDNGAPVISVALPNRVAIVRSDNHHALGVFKDSYSPHDYNEWLIGGLSTILGDTLIVSSAGLLRNGAQAWVEISVPETLHDEKTGISYRPNLLAATSLDGSLSTTFGRAITNTVCDNTMSAALGEMGEQKIKIKHSRYSGIRIDEARDALNLVTETADQFQAQIRELTETTVTDAQMFKFLDLWAPLPEEDGRGKTRVQNKRDSFVDMYRHDNRVAPWADTAYGIVQGVNTFAHHVAEVRGGTRAERNAERAIYGKVDALDAEAYAMISAVLADA